MTFFQKDTKLLTPFLLFTTLLLLLTSTEASPFTFLKKPSHETTTTTNNGSEDILISDVNLLLPPSTPQETITKTISASNGCFRWQNTNPTLLHMETHYDATPALVKGQSTQCASSVTVSPLVQSDSLTKRESATIIAEDQETGRVLRCEVFIDRLASIFIKTRTRTMNSGDDELITIQGRDSRGNVFSTLEGIIFKWDVHKSENSISKNSKNDNSQNDFSEVPLKIVPFRESSVAVSAAVERLEAQDRQTSAVLVRGTAVGEAIVSAVPMLRTGVEAQEVAMVVIQPLHVEPVAPLYVTKGATVEYRLLTVRNKEYVSVEIPSAQYKWTTSNPKVAKISSSGVLEALELGTTAVKVEFVGFSNSAVENAVVRELHVVDPASLDIRVAHIGDGDAPPSTLVSGSGSKVMVVGHNYTLDIDAFDSQYHVIRNDTLRYDTTIAKEYLDVLDFEAATNQHYKVRALKVGTTHVHATLKSVAGAKVKSAIQKRAEILITSQIAVQPQVVRLPWVQAAKLSQFRLESSGGSGEYKWYSNSTAVCTVSPAGVVTAVAEGVAEITVADMRNELNYARAVVIVSRPAALEFVPRDAEATVGSTLTLDLAVYDSDGALYDDCGSLPLAWETDAPVYINAAGVPAGVFRIKDAAEEEEEEGMMRNGLGSGASPTPALPFDPTKACTAKVLEAVGAGRTKVTASLNIENKNNNRANSDYDRYYGQNRFGYTLEDSQRAVISAETVVYAFNPLRVASPALPAPVTLGAEVTYTLDGGVEPFYLDPTAFYESMTATTAKGAVAIRNPTLGAKGIFTATCLAHSSQRLDAVSGNMPRQNLPRPLVTNTSAPFDCSLPDSLLIKPESDTDSNGQQQQDMMLLQEPGHNQYYNYQHQQQQHKDIKESSRRRSNTCAGLIGSIVNDMERRVEGAPLSTTYHLRNNRTIDIATMVLDDQHRQFYNSSTLRFSWSTSNPEVARWVSNDDKGDSKQKLVLGNVEGSAHVTVAVEGYQKLPAGIAAPSLAGIKGLKREFDVVLHRNVAVEPATISVVNNPRNLIEIRAMHGSGNYIFAIDDEAVARVERTTGTSVRIQPLRSGVVRVTAIDACLAHSEPAVATITISDVASLELSVPDLVQVGDRIVANVTALDVAGHPFDPSQYVFMDISLEVDNDVASSSSPSSAKAKSGAAPQQQLTVVERLEGGRFVLSGVSQGAPSVVATARGATTVGGRAIATAPAQVYVFPEFRLVPGEVTMVPGASYHLGWTGGPPVRYEVSFASAQPSIVSVANEYGGVITAGKIGSATVTATISAVDLITREKRVYGKATAKVLVSHLTGIRIRSATGRLVAGGEEDVWVEGLGASETPLSLGTLGIRFVWSVADPHVAALRGTYEEAGYPLDKDEAPYNARIVARAPGKTTVTVSIGTPLPANLPEEIYSRFSASMQLSVVEPLALVSPQSIVLPPHSAFPIRTTKDGSQSLRFHVLGATATTASALGNGDAKTPLITVDSRGVVKTYAGFGTAVVLVSDDEGSLPQSVAVTVKPVSHLQTAPVASAEAAKHRDLVVGSVTGFEVTLRDDLGQKFDALPAEDALLNAEVSDPELIAVSKVASNSTLLVRALKPGRSVIHTVLTASHSVESYATAYVGHMVEPMLPVVHIGAAISFTTSYATAQNGNINVNNNDNSKWGRKKGISWYTDDTSIVKIDGTTGTAHALNPGHCSVFYNGTTMFSHTEVTVAKIGKISLADGDPSQIPIITNAPSTAPSSNSNNNRRIGTVPARKLRLSFESEDGAPFTTSLGSSSPNTNSKAQINHNIQVQCSVTPAAWASAQAVQDPVSGDYFCAVTPVYPAPPREDAPDALIMAVKASDNARSYAVERAFKLKFQPQFVISPAPHVVRLSESRPKQSVEVRFGMATLTAAPRDPELLEVLQTAPGKYALQPRQKDASFTTAVDIADSATGQHEVVTVSYTPLANGNGDDVTMTSSRSSAGHDDDVIVNQRGFDEDGIDVNDYVANVRMDAGDKSGKKWLLILTLLLGIIVLWLMPKESI